jgi:hypothetical protein
LTAKQYRVAVRNLCLRGKTTPGYKPSPLPSELCDLLGDCVLSFGKKRWPCQTCSLDKPFSPERLARVVDLVAQSEMATAAAIAGAGAGASAGASAAGVAPPHGPSTAGNVMLPSMMSGSDSVEQNFGCKRGTEQNSLGPIPKRFATGENQNSSQDEESNTLSSALPGTPHTNAVDVSTDMKTDSGLGLNDMSRFRETRGDNDSSSSSNDNDNSGHGDGDGDDANSRAAASDYDNSKEEEQCNDLGFKIDYELETCAAQEQEFVNEFDDAVTKLHDFGLMSKTEYDKLDAHYTSCFSDPSKVAFMVGFTDRNHIWRPSPYVNQKSVELLGVDLRQQMHVINELSTVMQVKELLSKASPGEMVSVPGVWINTMDKSGYQAKLLCDLWVPAIKLNGDEGLMLLAEKDSVVLKRQPNPLHDP